MKQHCVYKTTNLTNDKYYIGVHSSVDPNDSYLGSGKYLKASVAKYGTENHKKEIMKICESREEAFDFEKLYISASLKDPLCMNMKEGGEGGFDLLTDDPRRLNAIAESFRLGISKGWQLSDEQRIRKGEKNGFFGKRHTDTARKLIGKAKELPQDQIQKRINRFEKEVSENGLKPNGNLNYGGRARLASSEEFNCTGTQVTRFLKQYRLIPV